PHLSIVYDSQFGWPRGPCLHLERATGMVTLRGMDADWEPFTPLADGKPVLQNGTVMQAQWRGKVLGVISGDVRPPPLRLFQGPNGVPLREFHLMFSRPEFALSSDGRLLVRPTGPNQVEVHDLVDGGGPVLVTPRGGSHQRLDVRLGKRWLTVQVGNF